MNVLLQALAPTIMFSLALAFLFLARDIDRLRREWKGKLYLIVAFGLISSLGLLGPMFIKKVFIDTAIMVVLVAGMEAGLAVGLGAGLLGTAVKLAVFPQIGALALIPPMTGLLGAAIFHLRRGRPVTPLGGSLAGLAAGLLQCGMTVAATDWVPRQQDGVTLGVGLTLLTGLGTGLFLVVLHYLQGLQDRARLNALMAETRLRHLQNQIRPHFLFNALNTVGSVCRTDPDKARELLCSLSEFLRASLKRSEPLIPLEEEIALVDAYLAIEKARYPDRLELERRVDKGLLDRPVPPLLVQTLVENAVIHGMPEEAPLRIECTAESGGNGSFRIQVRDNGRGFDGPDSPGIGLANARERLHLLYGDRSALEIQSRPGEGCTVTITIPDDPHSDR